MRNLQPFLDQAVDIIERHQLETGAYSRWLWQDSTGSRQLGLNEYGCADAANILYMVGRFPADAGERAEWVRHLQEFQHSDTGLFVEATHHPFHTTAHCIAALELFEDKAVHPLTAMHPLLDKEALWQFLGGLDWVNNPWTASHQGAGVFAALVLQGEAPLKWQDWYFEWLYENADPETGFWRKGAVRPTLHADSFSKPLSVPTVFPHLASTFHYLFNHEYAHRPLRYPDKMVDTCLSIYRNHEWESLGHSVSFAEIDWTYCLTRSLRQCGHRFEEAKAALRDFANEFIEYLEMLDPITDDGLNDLHRLFGCICALAELQAALPGELRSDKPLKLVLDRRPFI
ncbi:MAG: hypothetical protein IJM90_07070 [Firmicutes bacterium]|nr:hypothetical protein [Bacillota bacterium]